jgi:apolipoprotein D and lipocalin family protein
MKNKLLIIGVAIMVSAALYFGIDSLAAQNIKEPVTVPFVDIKKYVGTWYEQALIPFFFERGCSQSAAHYSLNDDGSIKVNNTCIRNGKHT